MAGWAVAVTWPHYERKVERSMNQLGFACYLPRCRNHTKRTTLLLPRYVFAGPVDQWHKLRCVHGVSRLLLRSGNDNRVAVVSEQDVAQLRQHENEDSSIKSTRKPRFRFGQRVRIKLGMWSGLIGLYQGVSRRNRDRVLLALGEVSLPSGNLVAD